MIFFLASLLLAGSILLLYLHIYTSLCRKSCIADPSLPAEREGAMTTQQGLCSGLHQLLGLSTEDLEAADRLLLVALKGTVVIHRRSSKPGKSVALQLSSRTLVDQSTGRGKLSREARLKGGKKTEHGKTKTVTYKVTFLVEPDFGLPGAVLVKNGHRREFFLSSMTLAAEGATGRRIHFDCNSWVYPQSMTKTDRAFFSNASYLPGETPEALRKLRAEELASLRGDGKGERKKWERIYDYDVYNDLGDPEKGLRYARPVLGGSPRARPYPRRGRTGRPPTRAAPKTESRPGILNLDIYVPPDERFSPGKLAEFIGSSVRAVVHFLVPELKSLVQKDRRSFESLEGMMTDLYTNARSRALEAWVVDKMKSFLPHELAHKIVRASDKGTFKFPVPQIIAENKWAWLEDEEFGREMLSGLNPAVIRRLEVFPPEAAGGSRSSITYSHVERSLAGLTVQQAMDQSRIFILNHHDYLLPYLRRIHLEAGVCVYASRTLLFLDEHSSLRPIAIELSLPGQRRGRVNRVFLPEKDGVNAALWQLAKAHVAANDSGHHQLISHWLKTHAVVEPFVIATRRQLSAMHPVHRLLEPHFKDTMQVNALARLILLNAGGVLERTMFPRKYAMELSSAVYKDWRFHEQALPVDLLERGMAVEDPKEPSGVRLLFEDYPYAVDGLDIWTAIKRWVAGFCAVFYRGDEDVASDVEIQAWWEEIRTVAHGDKTDDDWYDLTGIPELVEALTTLVWIASALHAAVNFGQYGYAGFPANRPPHCCRFIPEEGTAEFAEFMRDPDKFFMSMLPDRFTTALGLALIEVLSGHTSDEVYLGQRASSEWTDDEKVIRLFEAFREELVAVEEKIKRRNSDERLRNRRGPAKIAYTLLYPDTSDDRREGGITGRGIPNSVSM